MKKLFVLVFTTSFLLFGTVLSATDGIMIAEKNAWARATPPGSKTTAIYLTLMNHSNSNISLTAVTANISERVELHTHAEKDGLMKMQQVSSITVPAGGQVQLKPHSDHIMVFDLQEQLEVGKDVNLELTFDDGSTRTLSVPVFKQPPSGHNAEEHKHMKHEEKDPDATHAHENTEP